MTTLELTVMLLTFFIMEGVAWAAHKYLMHGFLWFLHDDHHTKTPGALEKNDTFFLIFAIPSWLCIMLGLMYGAGISVAVGAGIALYGFAYAMVHELFIHQRIPIFKQTKSTYLEAIRLAHKMHHRHLGREDGENFGMLWVHPKYIKQVRSLRAKS
ncbi:MAG: carotene hydroxylase [Bacteroidetes bacterium]|mgnify:FL=1|jgi:beta-carotene 3-hydroxylase|nr:sterol desaturase family protein [Cryomorphaceae bacterium]MBT4215600.1 carotene hydroxylase [Bacteroidota bacterium]MCO4791173.1 sterol desaturase family protein [Flavobacteriales bacterium]MDA8576673.1 sterol desaturase family protein [Schleiferiaceae bacterium]MBT6366661.1 carotene hydroxylase [Bacteroidota bacterium]